MECTIFLYQIQEFMKKTQRISNMMQELNNETNPEAINDVRRRFGLSSIAEVEIATNYICDEDEIVEGILEDETDMGYEENQSLAVCKDQKKNSNQEASNKKINDEKLFTFSCHICDVPEFAKMFQLSTHTRSEHNCLPMVRCFCDKILSTMRALDSHRAKHFPRSTDIRCTECARSFKTEKGVQNHFEKWHGVNKDTFICSRKLLAMALKFLMLTITILQNAAEAFMKERFSNVTR